MSYPSTWTVLNDAATGVSAEGIAYTADWRSPFYNLGDADWFGLWYDVSAASGTTPTLDITVEMSPDSGTTGTVQDIGYPAAANSQTGAAMTQVTAAGEGFKYWRYVLPTRGVSGGGTRGLWGVRFFFDTGGTSPSFTIATVRMMYVARGNAG